jgi:hypothetical protein
MRAATAHRPAMTHLRCTGRSTAGTCATRRHGASSLPALAAASCALATAAIEPAAAGAAGEGGGYGLYAAEDFRIGRADA